MPSQTEKAKNIVLVLNSFSTVDFIKLKFFYTEKYYKKQRIFKNKLSQFGV
jgi:hypothetical protein